MNCVIVDLNDRAYVAGAEAAFGKVSGENDGVDGILLSRDVTLQFQASQDEEHTQVRVVAEGVKKDFRNRSFDYMLLALGPCPSIRSCKCSYNGSTYRGSFHSAFNASIT